MPVHPVYSKSGDITGYKWGKSGKTYKTRQEAEKQARAIYASGYTGSYHNKQMSKK